LGALAKVLRIGLVPLETKALSGHAPLIQQRRPGSMLKAATPSKRNGFRLYYLEHGVVAAIVSQIQQQGFITK